MAKAGSKALDLWSLAEGFLPVDMGELAFQTGAIVRKRQVGNASQMLRAFLLYAHTGSFRTAAAMARGSSLLSITSEGLFFRLSRSEAFLEKVLAHLVGLSTAAPVGYRLLAVDATTVSGPGSKGTDWRVHVGYDPVRGLPCTMSVTGPKVGERLSLHCLQPGQLIVADRGYGTARNLHSAFEAGIDFVIRVSSREIRLFQTPESKVDWDALAASVPETGAVSYRLKLPVPVPEAAPGWRFKPSNVMAWHDVRLVAARSAHGDIVWLLTNLSEDRLADDKACEVYRARWQVELYFKRLKSIGDLDMQPSRDGPTARAGLLAKMILLVLTSLLQDQEQAFSPYGYPIRRARPEPVEGVRLHPQTTHRRPVATQAGTKGATRIGSLSDPQADLVPV